MDIVLGSFAALVGLMLLVLIAAGSVAMLTPQRWKRETEAGCQSVTGGSQVPPFSRRGENIFLRHILKWEGSPWCCAGKRGRGECDDWVDCDNYRRGECFHFLDACDRCLPRV